MYVIKRSTEEIDSLLNWAADGMDRGTHLPGMSYEEGIHESFLWLFGTTDENPMSDS